MLSNLNLRFLSYEIENEITKSSFESSEYSQSHVIHNKTNKQEFDIHCKWKAVTTILATLLTIVQHLNRRRHTTKLEGIYI